MRIHRCSAVIALAVTAAFLLPQSAFAGRVSDPADSTGPMDVRFFAAVKTSPSADMYLTIGLYSPLVNGVPVAPDEIAVFFDVNNDGGADFKGVIRWHAGVHALRMKMYDLGGSSPFPLIKVTHPRPRTVRVRLVHGAPWNLTGYQQLYLFANSCATMCGHDRAPDTGWVSTS
ncbi:MAG: hypothetical protein QOE83_1634 [Actinomycetota bacterium]|jgi:hypothetical protein|nr:hypothetical protein [Actinomycetota bacterium]